MVSSSFASFVPGKSAVFTANPVISQQFWHGGCCYFSRAVDGAPYEG
jgi:hypothetical protein